MTKSEQKKQTDKLYYKNNRDKILERSKQRYKANKPAKLAAYRVWQLQTLYGITKQQYDDMLIAQDGNCAICTLPMTQPHVDHNHKTGVVRGLLCFKCNTALGKFQDNVANLKRAITYLGE